MSMSHDEMIAVIQAHKDGKKIQWQGASGNWIDCHGQGPKWAFSNVEYRIKPKPHTIWVNEYGMGPSAAYDAKYKAEDAVKGPCIVRTAVKYQEVIE